MEKIDNNIRLGKRVEEYLVDVFRDMYYKEIESENAFVSNLAFTSGILLALGGVVAYLFLNFPQFDKGDILHIIFFTCFIFLAVVFLIILYYFFRATTGYEYAYIETSDKIYTYAEGLKKYYDENSINIENIEEILINDLRIYLLAKYSSACSKNANNNDSRWKYLRHTYRFIIVMVVVLFFSFISFSLVHHKLPRVQQIEIVNIDKVNIEKGGNTDVIDSISK